MRIRSVGALVVVLAVLASLAVTTMAAAAAVVAARPTVTVWPRTGLVDDQPLLIQVRDWVPSTYLVAWLCSAGGPAWGNNCDYVSELVPGPLGNLRVRRPADVVVDRRVGGPVDCREVACELLVRDGNGPHVPQNAVVRVPLTFDPDGPDPTRPETTATPQEDLRDGDQVRVAGHGYPLREFAPAEAAGEGDDGPSRPVYLYQCRAAPDSYRDCHDRSTVAAMTPNGDFGRNVTVRSRIYTPTGASVDCLAEPCAMVASSTGEFSEAGIVPLTFDPEGPVAPSPTVTITPDQDLVDGQVVEITAEHFPPNAGVSIAICPPDARGYYFLTCKDFFDPFIGTDGSGSATLEYPVHATFESRGATVDCRVVTCSIVVTWSIYVDDAPRAAVQLDPEGPLVDPQLTATPSTGLVGSQDVSVSGEGYFPTDLTRVAQCAVRRPHPDDDNCAEDDQLVVLDDSDLTSFTTTLRVHRRIRVAGGWVNCARRTCYIRSGDAENGIVRGPNLAFST